MPYCRNCGAEMEESQQYCVRCGAQVNADGSTQAMSDKKSELSVGMLVWSILNILMCFNVFGIVALVFTILACGKSEEESANNIKIAKIFNIIATVCAGLLILLYVFLFFIVMTASFSAAEYALESAIGLCKLR